MKRSGQVSARLRRKATRARIDLQATYHVAGFPSMPARVLEVSRTGIQLGVERELAPGTLVDVTFDPRVAADPRGHDPTRVNVRGRVVRLATNSTDSYVYGIDLQIDKATASTLQWLTLLLYATTP